MLAAWYKKQMVKEAEERGRAEAWKVWQDWRRELRDWERRKLDAEQAGREFSESPPAAPDEEQEIKV